MDSETKTELEDLLGVLPPVEFCCVYGSALHGRKRDKSSMVDYILGVSDPLKWHSEKESAKEQGSLRLVDGTPWRVKADN